MLPIEKVQARENVAGISFFLSSSRALSIAKKQTFHDFREQLFVGGLVNRSEQRAAWHTEFRNPHAHQTVQHSLEAIRQLSQKVRENKWFFTVTDVVNIGIGGSDLGPQLVCETFQDEINGPNIHFVSNLDTKQIQAVLQKISPQNTLFIVTSKSFRTVETLENMLIAKTWLLNAGLDPAKHLIAVTNNTDSAIVMHQIPDSQVLSIPEWMGGRYSLWSAVGLCCAIALGYDKWMEMHQGAHEMDQHFYHAHENENYVIQYALMMQDAVLHHSLKTLAVMPYTYALRTLPDYLQQLFMESLGKSVNQLGESITYPTGPIVFGGMGTNSQHSFQQLMMQGTHTIFADFILPLDQPQVIANCVTQVKTLREGVRESESIKQIKGGKTANLFAMPVLNLKALGGLIAFYEHAVVTLAFLLDINPFDQFGVEHGKRASESLLKQYGDSLIQMDQIEGILQITD